MKPLAALLPVVMASSSCALRGDSAVNISAQVDSIAHHMLAVDPTPGLSITVVKEGDTLVMRGYGLADVERGLAVSHRTVFAIGSVSKQITASAVVRLIEDGDLRLDTTVGEVLPEYQGPGRMVTIRQLLTHTSGIRDYARPGSEYWDVRHQVLTPAQILAFFATDPLGFTPGSRFSYGNSGYYLLGLIIERITGQRYGDFVERTLFEPLELEQTHFCSETNTTAVLARGYRSTPGGVVVDRSDRFENAGGAGGLCSTGRDLIRWERALMTGKVVSKASLTRMLSRTVAGGTEVPYGYGLGLGELEGYAFIAHLGSFPGFNAVLAHYPDPDLTIAVLANGSSLPVEYVEQQIARRVLGLDPTRHR